MGRTEFLLRSVGRHLWFWMGVALVILGLVPAVTQHTIPRWVYWLAALACLCIAFVKSWNEQYDLAEQYRSEVDNLYGSLILDWLQQQNSAHTPMYFPSNFIADSMKFEHEKVVRGLKILEKMKYVRDDGATGWFYDATRAARSQSRFRLLP